MWWRCEEWFECHKDRPILRPHSREIRGDNVTRKKQAYGKTFGGWNGREGAVKLEQSEE